MIYKKRAAVALIVLTCCFSLYGCPVLVVTGAAVAGGTGTYYYVEGEMRTDYYFSVDGVWSGVEKTIADMKGRDVEPDKQADGGTIVAVINDEKVTFRLKYKDKDLTSLGIRVGVMGNEAASKVIHDRVADNLLKK
jgi:hypothetical protein